MRPSPVNSKTETKKAKERLRGLGTCAFERLFWPPTCLGWGVWCRETCRDRQFCVSWPRFLSPFYSHQSCSHRRLALRQKPGRVARRRQRHHLQRLFLQPTSGSKSVGASGNQPRTRWPQHRFQHMTGRDRLASSTPIGNMLLRKMLPNAHPLFVRQPNHSSFIADRQQSGILR
jgi:hypothetical protein